MVTLKANSKKVLAVLIAVPLLLFMSSCMKMKMEVDIQSQDRVKLSNLVAIDTDFLKEMGSNEIPTAQEMCDKSQVPGMAGQIEFIPYEEGSFVGCEMKTEGAVTMMGATTGGAGITYEDGIYTFQMDDSGLNEMGDTDPETMGDMNDMITEFEIRVTFPGEVLTHSGSSTVSGTTVIWTDANDLINGLKATAKDSGSPKPNNDEPRPKPTQSSEKPSEETESPAPTSSEQKTEEGSNLWLIIGIAAGAVLLLAVIGVVVWKVMSNKKKAAQASQVVAGYPQQPYGDPYAGQQPQQPYGDPYAGQQPPQPYGDPYAGQQPPQPYGDPYAGQQPPQPYGDPYGGQQPPQPPTQPGGYDPNAGQGYPGSYPSQ